MHMLVNAENDYNFTVLSMSNHNQYAVSLAITNISSFFRKHRGENDLTVNAL